MIRIQEPGIDLEGGGACPVQVEGTVDGHYAYFRARGHRWQFTVAETAYLAIKGGEEPGVLFDRRRHWTDRECDCIRGEDDFGVCAGYMEHDVAERIIRDQIEAVRAQAAQREG